MVTRNRTLSLAIESKAKKGELNYLKSSLPSTVPDRETKEIPLSMLRDLQGEKMTTQERRDNKPKKPLVLKLRQFVIARNLNCFLETKANFAFNHRLESQVPRFSEDGPMTVKVYTSKHMKKRHRRASPQYPDSYLQHMGLVEETGKLQTLTPRDMKMMSRLENSLNSSLKREYVKEKQSQTFAERYLESKAFQVRSPKYRSSL